MRRKGGIGQLFKGVIIGIVLLLAIIGTTSILDKGKDKKANNTQSAEVNNIPAPSINIVSDNQKPEVSKEELAEETSEPIPPETQTTEASTENSEDPKVAEGYKPVLEGEKTAKDIAEDIKTKQEEKIQYGFLRATAIDKKTRQRLKASFKIFDEKNQKVIEGDSTNNPSFKLPVGRYRVIATLLNSKNQETNAESTQNIIIREEEITSKTFAVTPPVSIGILQVSAINAKNQQNIRANFTVQTEDGKIVATRNNVTNTLFKLKSGSYKVTVTSGENTDTRTVDIDSGESSKEVFKLQEASTQGKLLVRALEVNSSKKVPIDIIITNSNNETMQKLTEVSQTEITLPIGLYNINVTTPYAEANKNIRVTSGKTLNEIFRFDPPAAPPKEEPVEEAIADTSDTATKSTQEDEGTPPNADTNDEVKVSAVEGSTSGDDTSSAEDSTSVEGSTPDENEIASTPEQGEEATLATPPEPEVINDINEDFVEGQQPKGRLRLFARSNNDREPIKSNFYIQTLSGTHLAKKIYAENATFDLAPGTYKVTVRSTNRENLVKTIEVLANRELNSTFSLVSSNGGSSTATPARVSTPQRTTNTSNNSTGNGFLRVAMRPSGNVQANSRSLNTHFIVFNNQGQKIVELTNVPQANFKLDVGEYKITAINNRKPLSKFVNVTGGKTSYINFNSSDFTSSRQVNTKPRAPAAPVARPTPVVLKGGLRSHIVNQSGQHLKGNLTVTNSTGRIVARANNVTVGVFNLPADLYTVKLEYKGLQGSERIRILTGETTVQTFTIAQ